MVCEVPSPQSMVALWIGEPSGMGQALKIARRPTVARVLRKVTLSAPMGAGGNTGVGVSVDDGSLVDVLPSASTVTFNLPATPELLSVIVVVPGALAVNVPVQLFGFVTMALSKPPNAFDGTGFVLPSE